MSLRIDQDHSRFQGIVRGTIRRNLRRYISQGTLTGAQGRDRVSIPLPRIDIPRFRFSDQQRGGVGQGEGEPGDPVGEDEGEGEGEGEGSGPRAGPGSADHTIDVDVSLAELADILGEELALPRIEPRGRDEISERRDRYVGIRRVGPNSLRHFKRTYKEALRRQIAAGTYDARAPLVVPRREDLRFRSWKTQREPAANAVILSMMDVSGSMGDEQKEIVRIESFWIDAWLRRQYRGVETRFVIHDAVAREVPREVFFRTRESGGTMISSAYKLAATILEDDYPPGEWNVYVFHYSDGDNWSADDTALSIDLLRTTLLPASNLVCYGQVESPYGSGQFIKDLRERLGQDARLVTSEIRDRDAIIGSIKDFLGKGR